MSFLKNIAQLVIFPEKGWSDIVCSTASAGRLYATRFLPLVIVASLSAFIPLLYGGSSADAVIDLQRGIVCFFSLFVAYHVSTLALGAIMAKWGRKEQPDAERNGIFAAYSLSVVALIAIIANAVKVQVALVQFLPLYVAFIIWKGCSAMEVEQGKEAQFTVSASLAIVGSAYLFGFCFDLFI